MPVRVIKLPVLGQPAYALVDEKGDLTPSRESNAHPMLFESYYLANAALQELQQTAP